MRQIEVKDEIKIVEIMTPVIAKGKDKASGKKKEWKIMLMQT